MRVGIGSVGGVSTLPLVGLTGGSVQGTTTTVVGRRVTASSTTTTTNTDTTAATTDTTAARDTPREACMGTATDDSLFASRTPSACPSRDKSAMSAAAVG